MVKDLVASFGKEYSSTHFDCIAALGDNSAAPAPAVQPSASLLASLVPPRSIAADVADWRRNVADWTRNENAFGHNHRWEVDGGTWQPDEDLRLSDSIFRNWRVSGKTYQSLYMAVERPSSESIRVWTARC